MSCADRWDERNRQASVARIGMHEIGGVFFFILEYLEVCNVGKGMGTGSSSIPCVPNNQGK